MVFHYFLSLVEPPPLPIKLAYTVDEARSTCLQYLPKTKQALGTKPALYKLLPYLYLRVLQTHKYKTLFILIRCIVAYRYGIRPRTIVTALLALHVYIYLRQVYRVRKWSQNYTINQYKSYPNVRNEKYFKDKQLIAAAYKQTVAQYYSKHPIIYQPISGYCGYATVNTCVASIAAQQGKDPLSNGLLHFYRTNYISANAMCSLLHKLQQEHILSEKFGIARYENLCGADYNVFMSHIRELNNPKFTYMMYWHRSPLFFCDGSLEKRHQFGTTVHWSPLAAYLPDDNLILVLDVNEDYSEFLVTPERLFTAIDIPDYVDGSKMGLVRLVLNADE